MLELTYTIKNTKQNRTNENDFISFLSNIPDDVRSKVLYMDSFSLHKTQKVKEYLENNQFRFIFRAPYSPYMNLIEYFSII